MRKSILPAGEPNLSDASWLDLEALSSIQLTSEDAEHPIEGALAKDADHGWKAALPGTQTIWLSFHAPQNVRQIQLRFDSSERRTQEFVFLISRDGGRSYQDLVRQQFNFSPATVTEHENYFPDLRGVTDIKLTIVPDLSNNQCVATLSALRFR